MGTPDSTCEEGQGGMGHLATAPLRRGADRLRRRGEAGEFGYQVAGPSQGGTGKQESEVSGAPSHSARPPPSITEEVGMSGAQVGGGRSPKHCAAGRTHIQVGVLPKRRWQGPPELTCSPGQPARPRPLLRAPLPSFWGRILPGPLHRATRAKKSAVIPRRASRGLCGDAAPSPAPRSQRRLRWLPDGHQSPELPSICFGS